jgi:hypothetical protein
MSRSVKRTRTSLVTPKRMASPSDWLKPMRRASPPSRSVKQRVEAEGKALREQPTDSPGSMGTARAERQDRELRDLAGNGPRGVGWARSSDEAG